MSNTDPNRTGGVHGSSTITGGPKKKGPNWLPWLLAALGILLLLLLLSQCGGDDREKSATTASEQTSTTTSTTTTTDGAATGGAAGALGTGDAASTGPTGTATVNVPGASTSVTTGLQPYLAGTEAAGRRFTFDRLNFATGSAELPADAAQTIGTVAQILTASPTAAVRVEGYADARGSEPANQQLGAQRANAVAQALIAAGVPAARVTAASGGETNPVDSNATASGQAENRRTDLVVTAR
jgi:outer membrane protein OmpA-like peptidoglycan-associated protein